MLGLQQCKVRVNHSGILSADTAQAVFDKGDLGRKGIVQETRGGLSWPGLQVELYKIALPWLRLVPCNREIALPWLQVVPYNHDAAHRGTS